MLIDHFSDHLIGEESPGKLVALHFVPLLHVHLYHLFLCVNYFTKKREKKNRVSRSYKLKSLLGSDSSSLIIHFRLDRLQA